MLRETHESQQNAARRRAAIKSRAGVSRRPTFDGGSMPILSRTRAALLTGLMLVPIIMQAPAHAADAPTHVRVTTNMGDFVIELRADRAPLTVANFLRYVR